MALRFSKEARWAFYEKMWSSPGFTKLSSNYTDLTVDHASNATWCEFIAGKIRGIGGRFPVVSRSARVNATMAAWPLVRL